MPVEEPQNSWFERRPKTTMVVVVLVGLIISAYVAEKILASRNKPYPSYLSRYTVERHARLREHPPGSAVWLFPKEDCISELTKERSLLRIDRDGFVIPSQIHKHPDVTLVFLGGSTTVCEFVEEANRFPYRVGRLLETDTGLQVNSLNYSRVGNNTFHSINNFWNNALRFKPQVAVMMENVNDLAVLIYEKTYWNDNKYKSPIVEIRPSIMANLENALHLLRDATIPNLYRAFHGLTRSRKPPPDEFGRHRGKKTIIDTPALVAEFKMNLQAFIHLCRARRVTPVLMTMASRFKDDPDPIIAKIIQTNLGKQQVSYQECKAAFDAFNQAIRDTGAAHQVQVIDLARRIPPEREYLYDPVHFNDQGSKLVAQVIFEELKPLVASLKRAPAKVSPTRTPGASGDTEKNLN